MEYVKNNGGFLRLELRFQDGLPVVAEEVRKQVRFSINNNKGKLRRYEVINPVDKLCYQRGKKKKR